jgi:hypothetical protein
VSLLGIRESLVLKNGGRKIGLLILENLDIGKAKNFLRNIEKI